MESTWQSAHSKHSVCDSKIGVFLHSPAVSLPFQPYPDVLNHCCLGLQDCQKHLGQREALSNPSPTPGYCRDPKAKGHRFSSGTAMGCDRTAPRIGLNEGPCSTVDPREMCVYVSVWWCVGRVGLPRLGSISKQWNWSKEFVQPQAPWGKPSWGCRWGVGMELLVSCLDQKSLAQSWGIAGTQWIPAKLNPDGPPEDSGVYVCIMCSF